MGASNSIIESNARNTISTYFAGNKPLDGSDITDLETARQEVGRLRKLIKEFHDTMKDDFKTGKGHKKREAVRDQAKQIQPGEVHVPKVVPKPDPIRRLLRNIVTSNVLFSSYAQEEHDAIVDAFESVSVTAESFVIRQGESGDNFYVVESGSLNVFVKNIDGVPTKVGNSLESGASFGELALMYNTPRAASIKASTDCVLWQIDRNSYRGIIVYFKHMRNKQYISFLKNVVIKDKKLGLIMTDDDLGKMTVSLERETFETGEAIVRQGNTGDHFYIIEAGNVGVFRTASNGKEEKLTTLNSGDYFGEKALLSEDVRQASCIAESKVVCLTLGRDDFIDMVGNVEEILAKDAVIDNSIVPPEPGKSPRINRSLNINISDLQIMNTIGMGAFGQVKLCRHPDSDKFFALKCQGKKAIQDNGLEEHVLNEVHVLSQIDHPLISKLHLTLQDKRYIYFVLELLQGGELFTLLRKNIKFPEQSARFYAASVLSAFSCLHAKRIAYRDLKPENLVMDDRGYIKLVDFGLAKILTGGKTWTLCGTPDYLAPEIILNEGHDIAVDYWAIGVLIFEMTVGTPPFFADDPMEVYEKILGANPPIPTFFSKNLADLIKKLLRLQQGKRLGNTRGGTMVVIKHKWFSSFDWQGLENGEMTAPHKPIISKKDDVSNFEVFDDQPIPEESDWNPQLL